MSGLDAINDRLDRAAAALAARPFAVIFVLWALASLPFLGWRSFIWEEGNNAAFAADLLSRGDILHPQFFGMRWAEKPALLPWLIAGLGKLFGVNEWTVRLPSMLSVLGTALLVHILAKRYASAQAALVAALTFLLCPLILRKLSIGEPDTLVTFLSFATFVVWWNGAERGALTWPRWLACALLLAVLVMAKGPQPGIFFGFGVSAYALIERRGRDIPGLVLCALLPGAAIIGWAAAVYQPGDDQTWREYLRFDFHGDYSAAGFALNSLRVTAGLVVELLPATLMLPFVPWPWSWPKPRKHSGDAPAVVAPLILYATLGAIPVLAWPATNGRYVMAIVPALAVLAAIGFDRVPRPWLRRAAIVTLGALALYAVIFTTIAVPLNKERFGASRIAGRALQALLDKDPGPAVCIGFLGKYLIYLDRPIRCIDPRTMADIEAPATVVTDPLFVLLLARQRRDLGFRPLLEPDRDLLVVRIEPGAQR